MTDSEKFLEINKTIVLIQKLRKVLPDLADFAGDVNGDDAEVKRYLQCKSIEDALRRLQMDVEEDRNAMCGWFEGEGDDEE